MKALRDQLDVLTARLGNARQVLLIILIILSDDASKDPVTIFHLSGLDWKQHLWSRKSR